MIARHHDKQISPHLVFAYLKAISAGVVYLGVLIPMLYIPFQHPFWFGHWNGIFRYRSVSAFRFGFTTNIYIYIATIDK